MLKAYIKRMNLSVTLFATHKSAYIDILWVKNIYYDMLRIFILPNPLLLTSTHVDSLTNCPIQILLPTPFRIYMIICFIRLVSFPMLLCVSMTKYFLTISSPTIFLHCQCFVFCNLVFPFSAYTLCYGSARYMGYCHGWCTPYFFSPNILLLYFLSWIFGVVRLML